MEADRARKRPPVAARRVGYVVAVGVNAALLYAVNGWPGWEAVPFLTEDTRFVTGLVNVSIIVNLSVNVVYLVRDPPRVKALGDLLTLAVGIAALLRIWDVFPFDFGDTSVDWAVVVRILLVLAVFGSAVGIIVSLVSFVRSPADARSGGDRP